METEKLNELIGYLTDTIKSSGEYIKETAPEFINELVAYEVMTSWIFIWISGFVWLICSISFIATLCKCDSEDMGVCGFFFGVGLVSLIPLVINIFDLIKISVAPKLFILDYLKTLV